MAQLRRGLPDSPPLLVVGMHRSGTSLVARLLSDLGVHMGQELEQNHESVAFLQTNNELLGLAGSYWAKPEPFLAALEDPRFLDRCVEVARRGLGSRLDLYGEVGSAPAWGFKDPRTTLTLPVWLRIFPSARVLHVIRNGVDVASSLCRRELHRYTHRVVEKRMVPTPGAAFRLWQEYVEAGQRAVQDHEGAKLTVRYEELLAKPAETVAAIARLAGLHGVDMSSVLGRIGSPSRQRVWVSRWLRWQHRFGRLDTALVEELDYSLD